MSESVRATDWPFSLPRDIRDPFTYDVASYRERFEMQSDRLFCSPEATKIKILSLGSGSKSSDLPVERSWELTVLQTRHFPMRQHLRASWITMAYVLMESD